MLDRSVLAELWHERAKVTRENIFGTADAQLRPVSSASEADVAVPGMVGGDYQEKGLAIVSVNPAGGKDNFRPTSGDARLYQAVKEFTISGEPSKFEEVNEAYYLGMPSWGPQWVHVNAILAASRQNLRQVAYPYLVPYRTRGDSGSTLKKNVIDRAYRAGFAETLRALKPSLVVPVDRHSEAAVYRAKAALGLSFDIIYYTRQRNAHAARAATLKMIAASFDQR
ncbi:hypothetical protein [Novosphingobium mathurense]|uniref:hypothetical protein n=1 Tax=Novosphingobium mathurense TaxID=428990 RepID=UPI001116F190|nr:hypothetical protein [Novosphingobium mathurense]